MDKERQLRLLIPPFFVIASLLWGAHVDGIFYPYFHATCCGHEDAFDSLKMGFSILGLIGVTTLPAGYLIGVVTISFFRCVGKLFPLKRYDLTVRDEETMNIIWTQLRAPRISDLDFYAAAFFDHFVVRNRIHEWQVRRWTAFNIATQSVAALILSVVLGYAFGLSFFARKMLLWSIPVYFLIAVLLWHSWETWWESANMFRFAATTPAAIRSEVIRRPDSEADAD